METLKLKAHKLLTTGIIVIFILSIGAVFPVRAHPGINVYVSPALVERYTNTTHVGDTFTITLNYGNMTNLAGIQYTLYWNNTALNVTSVHDTLPWSGSPFVATNTTMENYNATFGQMNFVAISLGTAASGSATFRTITFKILSAPPPGVGNFVNSTIAFGPYGTETIFGGTGAVTIPATVYNGEFSFTNPAPVAGPPVTTNDYDGLWHTANFTITLTATGGTGGIAHTFYKINGGTTKEVKTNGQPEITTEGSNNTLEYWSQDSVGNIETHHLLTNIKLDKTAPTGSIAINNGATETTSALVTLTLTASDKISGVDKIKLGNDANLTAQPFIAFLPTESWQLTPGDGNKVVYFEIRDVAGLISMEYSASIVLNTTVTEKVGEALHFNGVNQYVSVPNLNFTVYTFELWFNLSSTSSALIGSDLFRIDTNSSGLIVWYNVTKAPLEWNTAITTGVWHDLIVTIDYRVWNISCYLDGTRLGSKNWNTFTKLPTTAHLVKIGSDGAGEFFNGTIDEVRIYDKVLGTYAAKCHYNNGIGYYGRLEDGLIAGWHFDESNGTVAADYSGNNRNGTIYGATWVEGQIRLPDKTQGDMNADGKVNILDLIIVVRAFGTTGNPNNPSFPDTHGNTVITILDVIIVAHNLGKTL